MGDKDKVINAGLQYYSDTNSSIKTVQDLRRDIVLAAHNAGEGHIPSALSILDLVHCIYFSASKKYNLDFKTRDTFILSKGHGSLALYSVLSCAGYFADTWVEEFTKFESPFGGHPDRNKIEGVNASTGSLGHGLAIGLGIAFANRIRGEENEVIVLIGDGELNEGSVWESLLLASNHDLNKITVIVDNNNSTERSLSLGNLEEKFNSFGFITYEIDGHSVEQIENSLEPNKYQKPKAIIANTIKGYGIKSMENNPAWHHATPTVAQLTNILSEIE